MKIIKVDTIKHANSFFKRLKGYMFQKRPNCVEVMIFDNCNSVHTFNMKFNLDILFLDAHNRVVKKAATVPRGRFIAPVREATRVVEAPEGLFNKIEENEVVSFDAAVATVSSKVSIGRSKSKKMNTKRDIKGL